MPTNAQLVERRSARTPAKVAAKLLVNSQSGNYVCQGLVYDCGEHGLRIETTFPFLSPGQRVEIVLVDKGNRSAQCRVIWVGRPGSENPGQVGLELLTPLKVDCGSHE